MRRSTAASLAIAMAVPFAAARPQVATLAGPQASGVSLVSAPPLLAEKNATGFPLGGFTLLPALRLSAGFDDNIYRRSSGLRQGDGIFTLEPSVGLRSDWAESQLDLQAYSIHTRYARYGQNDSDQYKLSGNGSFVASRALTLTGLASYGHLIQNRGEPGGEFEYGRFAFYNVTQAAADAAVRVNRLLFTLGLGTNRYQYDDVRTPTGPVDQSYRDHHLDTARFRADYQADATTTLFLTASPDRYRYAHSPAGLDRASSGFTVLGGVNSQITPLLRGEIGLGYLAQNFRSPAFASFHGLNYSVSLAYAPTPLTTMQFSASRGLENSALREVPGILTSRFRLVVNHELTRKITLAASAQHEADQYRGIARTANRIDLSFSAHYAVRRFLSLAPFFHYQTRSSGIAGALGKYRDSRAGVSLVVDR